MGILFAIMLAIYFFYPDMLSCSVDNPKCSTTNQSDWFKDFRHNPVDTVLTRTTEYLDTVPLSRVLILVALAHIVISVFFWGNYRPLLYWSAVFFIFWIVGFANFNKMKLAVTTWWNTPSPVEVVTSTRPNMTEDGGTIRRVTIETTPTKVSFPYNTCMGRGAGGNSVEFIGTDGPPDKQHVAWYVSKTGSPVGLELLIYPIDSPQCERD